MILDRAARPLVEPEIRGVDPELTSDEDDAVVRYFRTSARELAVAAVVLQQHRETQRSIAPLTGEQRSIFIQQGPELDQLVNVKRGRLHAPQSFPRAKAKGARISPLGIRATPAADSGTAGVAVTRSGDINRLLNPMPPAAATMV